MKFVLNLSIAEMQELVEILAEHQKEELDSIVSCIVRTCSSDKEQRENISLADVYDTGYDFTSRILSAILVAIHDADYVGS